MIGSYNLECRSGQRSVPRAKSPSMGTEGLETIKQKVLTHQMSYSMPIEEYRKVLQILDSRMLSDSAKTQQLINLMWNNVTKVVNSVQSKLDIIFLGALSNKGVFTFDTTNNSRGRRSRYDRLQNAVREHCHRKNIMDGWECRNGRYIGRHSSLSSTQRRTKLRSTVFCSRRNACRTSSATRR
ncbi:MAG: hypothetical protein ACLTZY_16100 [Alistipes indistinctus]